MDRDQNNREYTNGEITVYWKPSKCIHATTCYRELIEVFNPRKRPWVNMKGASTEEIIRVVDLCPTDALTYMRNTDLNSKPNQEADRSTEVQQERDANITEVRIMQGGPLIIKGEFKIIGSDGLVMRKMKMTSFCRCGKSGNMPFCDGTHRKHGFDSE